MALSGQRSRDRSLTSCGRRRGRPARALSRFLEDLEKADVAVRFAAVHAPVREYAGRLSLAPLVGLDEPYPSACAALADRTTP